MVKDIDDFAELIHATRQASGLTQEEFARNLGFSFLSVNRWENNKTKPSPTAKQKILQFMKNLVKKKRLNNKLSNTLIIRG